MRVGAERIEVARLAGHRLQLVRGSPVADRVQRPDLADHGLGVAEQALFEAREATRRLRLDTHQASTSSASYTSAASKCTPWASLADTDGAPLIGQSMASAWSFQAIQRSCSGE